MLIPIKELLKAHNLDIKGIVHCGASYGQERDYYASMGLEEVIWIEAIPEVFDQLAINIEPYPNQIAVNACLGDVDGNEVVFNVSNNEAQSSSYLQLGTHKTAHPEVHYVKTFKTKTSRLDRVLYNMDIEIGKGWLLVGDLQGAEMLMLKGAGDLLHKFDACYLEVNTQAVYEGCALKDEVEGFLANFGFVGADEMIYEQWGWGDKLFVRG